MQLVGVIKFMNKAQSQKSSSNSLVIALIVMGLLSLVFGGVYLINKEKRRREELSRICYAQIVNGYSMSDECQIFYQ